MRLVKSATIIKVMLLYIIFYIVWINFMGSIIGNTSLLRESHSSFSENNLPFFLSLFNRIGACKMLVPHAAMH
jgi:hypothetical protein